MGNGTGQAKMVSAADHLDQMPAGKVGRADVTSLSRPDQVVEGAQSFFDRRKLVIAVELQQIDVVTVEAFQRGLAGLGDVLSARAHPMRPWLSPVAYLCGDQDVLSARTQRLSKDLFRGALRIDIGGVEEVESGVYADVNESPRFTQACRAP